MIGDYVGAYYLIKYIVITGIVVTIANFVWDHIHKEDDND